MRIAETVTFGGGGLERAAHLRADPAGLAQLRADTASKTIVFWRGKPLVSTAKQSRLVRLSMQDKILKAAPEAPVFLGMTPGGALFGHDIAGWQPPGSEAPETGFFDASEQHHPGLPAGQVFAELRGHMAGLNALDAELAATARALFGWHQNHRFCARCGAPSEMAMAGWQRDCAACSARHFPRVDPVVIMLITRGNKVLVGRSPGWPERMYSLLAGFVEPGETIEAAVRREVLEEAGINVGAVRYLASQPWAFPSSLMIGCHGAALNDNIVIDPVEIEAALWLSREEMMDVFAGLNHTIQPARVGSIAHFLLHNWLADRLD
ncbi:MAG: NAD(+) diphosphatase [Paracoccaceae bacterium]